MSCDVGELTERLENEQSCDVGEVTERLVNEQSSFSKLSTRFTYVTTHSSTLPSPYLRHSSFSKQTSFSKLSTRFTYVTTHSPTLPSLYLGHSSFSNPSVASPTSQLILQPFLRFSYLTGFSLTSPGEPLMNITHGLRLETKMLHELLMCLVVAVGLP